MASAQRGSVALAKNAPCTVASASSDIATNHPRDARDTAVIDDDEFEHGRASDRTLILILHRTATATRAGRVPRTQVYIPPECVRVCTTLHASFAAAAAAAAAFSSAFCLFDATV